MRHLNEATMSRSSISTSTKHKKNSNQQHEIAFQSTTFLSPLNSHLIQKKTTILESKFPPHLKEKKSPPKCLLSI